MFTSPFITQPRATPPLLTDVEESVPSTSLTNFTTHYQKHKQIFLDTSTAALARLYSFMSDQTTALGLTIISPQCHHVQDSWEEIPSYIMLYQLGLTLRVTDNC